MRDILERYEGKMRDDGSNYQDFLEKNDLEQTLHNIRSARNFQPILTKQES